jgi:hypothetical protein
MAVEVGEVQREWVVRKPGLCEAAKALDVAAPGIPKVMAREAELVPLPRTANRTVGVIPIRLVPGRHAR